MAICAVIDLTTNQQLNTIVAEVTDLAPENCKLVEIPEGMLWDSATGSLIPQPIPETTEETITEEEPSPPPDTEF